MFFELIRPQAHADRIFTTTVDLHNIPVEDDQRYTGILSKINDKANEVLAEHQKKGNMGFVHIIWSTKQRILKQKYDINWRTPAELNPQELFD